MDAHAALVLHRDAGGSMHLATPIPSLAICGLHALMSAQLREWLLLSLDGNSFDLCGHTFAVTGWVASPTGPGLVVEHDCGTDCGS